MEHQEILWVILYILLRSIFLLQASRRCWGKGGEKLHKWKAWQHGWLHWHALKSKKTSFGETGRRLNSAYFPFLSAAVHVKFLSIHMGLSSSGITFSWRLASVCRKQWAMSCAVGAHDLTQSILHISNNNFQISVVTEPWNYFKC